jgi:nitroreductase
MSAPTPRELNFILKSGILAPSADNHHQLRFEVDRNALNVWSTQGALPMAGGYKRVLALLSLGAVFENLTIAASRFGIRAMPELFPDLAKPDLIFQVRWRLGGVEPDLLWETIPQRHTNRRLIYKGPKLNSEDRSSLEHAASGLKDCSLVWLDNPIPRRQALRLMLLAEGERFRNRMLHEELFSAIRFDVGWEQSCEEGLPPGVLGIEQALRPAFASLRHWKIMKMLNLLGGHRLLGWRATDLPCRLAPHLGVISASDGTDASVFAAGGAFQRVWLGATRLGLALQPMPASALYALEGAQKEGIPAVIQRQLQHGWQNLLSGRVPLMLFRTGVAPPPAITTDRKPLEHYIA